MKLRPVAKVAGIVAIAPFALLPIVLLPFRYQGPVQDGFFEAMVIGMLAAIPLGIFSGIFWTKWLFAVAFLAAALIVCVGYLSAGNRG